MSEDKANKKKLSSFKTQCVDSWQLQFTYITNWLSSFCMRNVFGFLQTGNDAGKVQDFGFICYSLSFMTMSKHDRLDNLIFRLIYWYKTSFSISGSILLLTPHTRLIAEIHCKSYKKLMRLWLYEICLILYLPASFLMTKKGSWLPHSNFWGLWLTSNKKVFFHWKSIRNHFL